MKALKKHRTRIDRIDSSIIRLLGRRAGEVVKIGRLKAASGSGVFVPSREKQILSGVTRALGRGPSADAVRDIYGTILSSMRSIEASARVVFFGRKGTFTHLAAIKQFGRRSEYVPASTIEDVFRAVQSGRAAYGVVPVENSTEGAVNYTLDMFLDYDLKIYSEILLEVRHNLVSTKRDTDNIRTVYSHPQAIAQCRNWLARNLPRAEIVETASTAEAARLASARKGAAAIASLAAADEYKLNVLASGIQDNLQNFTRFLVIANGFASRSGDDKTSVLFSIKDRVGALYDILYPFKKRKINLTKIESRPTKKKAWEYVFFIDFLGYYRDRRIQEAIDAVKDNCVFFKVIGSYPRAE